MKQSQVVVSEAFGRRNRHYFLDYKVAVIGSHYLQITRSDRLPEEGYRRDRVIFHQEDFEHLIQALSSLFHAAAYMGVHGGRGGAGEGFAKAALQARRWDQDLGGSRAAAGEDAGAGSGGDE